MKEIPNFISVSRIFFSLALILVKPLSSTFYIIYIICGFSDIMDGFIARKTGTTSAFGAKLDSVADMIMIGVLLFLLYPIINPKIEIIICVILIGTIRLIAMIVALKKYKTFASIHTYGNKITGIILFLFPILIPYIQTTILMYVICIVASISATEELIIQLTSHELQLNKQSIFIESEENKMNPEEIVKKQLDFYNKHDLEGFMSTYNNEVEIYNLIDNSIMIKGKEQLKNSYRERFEVLNVYAEIENRIVIGNKVIDNEYVTGLEKDAIKKAVAIYEIENNLIKRVWFVFE